MNELALFAGAGGGLLGTKLLGWHPVCAVEIDLFCQNILFARQRDGHLPRFPIWDDVRTFDGHPWRGYIDVVTAGFPCQPFSTASRGRVVAKDLWSHVARIIGEVEPPHVLAENVQRTPIARAAYDLTRLGYVCHIVRAPASCVGAPHRRVRYWVLAHHHDAEQSAVSEHAQVAGVSKAVRAGWWEETPGRILGMDDGVANRMDRLRALGNGQVPAVVRRVWNEVK